MRRINLYFIIEIKYSPP